MVLSVDKRKKINTITCITIYEIIFTIKELKYTPRMGARQMRARRAPRIN